jgi:SAM-dependent methyltransferase
MKIKSASDVFELLGAYVPSAVLGSSLELGLFWKLAEKPMTADALSSELNIPLNRCRYWLGILLNLDLLQLDNGQYSVSEAASASILSTFSQDAWHNIASQSADSYPYLKNLSTAIHEPGDSLAAQGMDRKSYFQYLKEDPERAKKFTRMLYDFHQPLAGNLSEAINMDGVQRMMDLGGGSGIMSNAILKRSPEVLSTLVDIKNVCQAGKEIVSEFSTADRISYFPADFMAEELPKGFDLILECDVCVYTADLFKKLKASLNPGGRLVIVDQFAPESGAVPPGRPLAWGFIGSLEDPDFAFPTAAEVTDLLLKAGFQIRSETQLPDNWLLIDSVSD